MVGFFTGVFFVLIGVEVAVVVAAVMRGGVDVPDISGVVVATAGVDVATGSVEVATVDVEAPSTMPPAPPPPPPIFPLSCENCFKIESQLWPDAATMAYVVLHTRESVATELACTPPSRGCCA